MALRALRSATFGERCSTCQCSTDTIPPPLYSQHSPNQPPISRPIVQLALETPATRLSTQVIPQLSARTHPSVDGALNWFAAGKNRGQLPRKDLRLYPPPSA